jgi:hypothetical protein
MSNCDTSLAQARAVAEAITVNIEVPQRARVGEPIKVSWSKRVDDRPQVPTYLVLTTPAEVRFAGTDFMALAAGAKGPHRLAHGNSSARALVPLHRVTDTATSGAISVRPYARGMQTIAWAVVTAGSCGERVLSRGERSIEVAVGAPEIVVQDRFATDAPIKRVRSPAKTHELLVFKDRYEIHDGVTGAKIMERPGTWPAFSPTGRFVAARHTLRGDIEVFDLLSGRQIAAGNDGLLAWLRADSYLIYAGGTGAISIWNTLADGKPLMPGRSLSCMACGEQSVSLIFDLERGYAAAGALDWAVVDLVKGTVGPDRDTEIERLNEEEKYDEAHARLRQLGVSDPLAADRHFALAHVRRDYNASLVRFPRPWAWEVGEKLRLTNDSDAERFPETAPQGQHAKSPARPKAGNERRTTVAAAKGLLVGTARSGRGYQDADPVIASSQGPPGAARAGNSADVVFARLATAGIATLPLTALERVYLTDVWDLVNGAGEKGAGEGIAREIRALMPASAKLFRMSLECSYENEPDDAVLVDPKYISQVWRWRDDAGERMLLQTICYLGAAGRGVSGNLFVLQPNAVSKATNLIGGDAIEGMNLTDDVARLRIFRVAERSFAVAVGLQSRIAVIDPLAGSKIGAEIPLIDGMLLVELRLTADGKHLVQLNSDGRFFVHRIADGQRALIGAQVDDEIVIANDDGLYDTTYEGAQAVQVRFPGMRGLHRFNQFEAALRRPGLAPDVLAGRSIAPPPAAVPVPPTAELTLEVAVRDGHRTGKVIVTAERGLAAVRIYLDGRLVQQLGVNGSRAEIPIHLPDPGGGRWISAVAVDTQGLVSQPSAVQMPGKPQARGTLRAVVIGVDAYEDPGLPRLAFAKSDAQRFVRALGASRGKSVQRVQVTSLLDAEVTPERVLAAVREAAQATTPDDMLVIFYAGHGLDGRAGGQSDAGLVLTTPKTRMAELKSTALPWTALADVSDARGTIVVVLDACHAGIAGSDAFATNDDAVSALITRAGAPMVVLAGSKGRQLSHETAQAGGGLFTEAIAKAISEARATHDRDRSGLIDLGELYTAVKARVFEATKGRQTPWLARNALVGEMALF